jgi:hypothetical protein
METINRQFGLIVAYLLPGFIGLGGIALLVPPVARWLEPSIQPGTAGLGPPVYAVLAATASRSQYHRVLTNPLYCGIIDYAGERHEGRHEPIITKRLFDAAQGVMPLMKRSIPCERKFKSSVRNSHGSWTLIWNKF